MKKNLIKTIAALTVFAFGVGFLANQFKEPIALEATQHAENYDDYTYSGNYYSSIASGLSEGLQGNLRKSLSSLILPKAWYTYSGAQAGQLGSVLQSADEDPTNSANMVLFYTRDSVTKRKSGDGTGNWNREHVWPQSLSNNHWGKEKAGVDILHIRPTWYDTNSTRGNLRYGDLNKVGQKKYEGMLYGYANGSFFEPIDAVKGDVARIIMYVWTAYYDYYNDSNLLVTKTIESYDTLLKWHTLDKPDALEGHRNDFSESSNQKNRNPFVDHPEYAWKIFGEKASDDIKNSCKAAYPSSEPEVPPETSSSSQPAEQTSVIDEASSEIKEDSSISNQEEPKKNDTGCNGSIIGIMTTTSVTALTGLVFIFSKKKED